jgi:hypothetical protein
MSDPTGVLDAAHQRRSKDETRCFAAWLIRFGCGSGSPSAFTRDALSRKL